MNTLSLSQLGVILRARWRSSLAVFVSVVALAVAGTLLISNKYTAMASVVLDVKSPDPIAGLVLPGMTAVGYMATQVGIMQSERVALRAIQKLNLENDPVAKAHWQAETGGRGSFQSWLSDGLLRKIEIQPARDSNVITVSYTGKDPKFAADVANAFIKAYMETTLELRVEPARQFYALFDDRAKHLRDELEMAQSKLSDYQRSKGILVTDEKLDVENSRMTELTSQLVNLQGLANESGNRQTQGSMNPDNMSEVLSSPLIMNLTADLARQQASLDQLRKQLGDKNPQVQQLGTNVAALTARIALETNRITQSVRLNNSVNINRVTALRASIEQQRAKLLSMKSQQDEARTLERDVDAAQKAYDSVTARVSEAGLESQATRTNVSVLKEASVPPLPSSPRVTLNIAIGVLLGALLALATAIFREMRDQRLRTESDVVQLLRQPVFGVLPKHVPSSNAFASARKATILRRLTGILPQGTESRVSGPA